MLLHEKVKDGGLNKPEEKSKSDGKSAGGTVTMKSGAEEVKLSQDKAYLLHSLHRNYTTQFYLMSSYLFQPHCRS